MKFKLKRFSTNSLPNKGHLAEVKDSSIFGHSLDCDYCVIPLLHFFSFGLPRDSYSWSVAFLEGIRAPLRVDGERRYCIEVLGNCLPD